MELRAQRLAVEILCPLNLVGLFDSGECSGIGRQCVGLEQGAFAVERRQVEKHPEVGFAVGQFDLEFACDLVLHEQLHPLLGCLVLHRQVEVAFFNA